MSPPPWHLWGNTQRLEFSLPPNGTASDVSHGQLCRVPYLRPETWHWFFFAQIAGAPAVDAATQLQISIAYELTIGIGRSQVTIPGFDQATWVWTNAAAPLNAIYSSQTNGPNRNFGAGTPSPSVIDQIIAQDIQLTVRSQFNLSGAPIASQLDAAVLVTAMFAPKTHIRPEWFEQIGRFKGQEDKAL